MAVSRVRIKLRTKILFSLILFITLAAVAEAALRLFGAAYPKFIPHAPETTCEKCPIRILCVGDSFTYGVGADQEHSYPRQLQQFLDQHYGTPFCQVTNLGVPGKNSSETLLILERALSVVPPPTFILAAVGINNYWNWHWATTWLPGDSPLAGLHAMFSGSRLWRLLTMALAVGPRITQGIYQPNKDYDPRDAWYVSYAYRNQKWLDKWLQRDLEAISDLGRQSGAQMVLLGYHRGPFPIDYRRLAGEEGWPYIELRDFGNSDDPTAISGLISADGWHPNGDGYGILARLIEADLEPLIRERLSR